MKGFFMCSSMDGLAANGIINFNPDAYVQSGVAQYAEEQSMELPFDRPLYATPYVPYYRVGYMNPGQPLRDTYVRHESRSQGLSGIDVLAGILVGGAATYLGVKVLSDNKVKPATAAAASKKGFFTKCKDAIFEAKDTVVSWVKKIRGVSDTEKLINEAAKNSAKEQKGFFTNRFYKTKIAGCIAAGVIALYAIYKAVAGRSRHGSEE